MFLFESLSERRADEQTHILGEFLGFGGGECTMEHHGDQTDG